MSEHSSDSVIFSSDDDNDFLIGSNGRSNDLFECTHDNSIILSSRAASRDGSPVRIISNSSSGDDDAVVILDDDDEPPVNSRIVPKTVDPVVVEISDTEANPDVLEIRNDVQLPKKQPIKRKPRKKKHSINLSELEEALSQIALADDSANKERLSFLSSLSEKTFGLPVHPEAQFYKLNFKYMKEKLTEALFKMFNSKVFSSGLSRDMKIEWSGRLTSTAGKTLLIRHRTGAHESSILLSSKILTTPEKLRDTLIHEMCHAAAWTIDKVANANHGPVWKKWTKLARKRFPELPPIDVRHTYSIEFKYNWECQQCGHTVGRHKNTVDVRRHRCPFCHGHFLQV